jgi:hypothetical protein
MRGHTVKTIAGFDRTCISRCDEDEPSRDAEAVRASAIYLGPDGTGRVAVCSRPRHETSDCI